MRATAPARLGLVVAEMVTGAPSSAEAELSELSTLTDCNLLLTRNAALATRPKRPDFGATTRKV